MTVAYMQYTHTAAKFGVFVRVLRMWKGGVYKGVWRDLLVFSIMYFSISILYRYVLSKNDVHKETFEIWCVYCAKYSYRIPLSFILGFYVTQVVSRWWDQWRAISWPDRLAQQLCSYLDDRMIRRVVVRWVCLSHVLIMRMISVKVAMRFPTLEHLIEAGLLTPKELGKLDNILEKTGGKHDISWYPIQWSIQTVKKARSDGLISADLYCSNLHNSLLEMANSNWRLYCYGWISIPLVYTQLVTIAVYSYFLAALFGRQYLQPTQYHIIGNEYVKAEDQTMPNLYNKVGYDQSDMFDMIIPCFTLLEFIFYFGWLKVAESLINPFGEDDDDFETNYMIDRNVQLSYIMVEREDLELEDPWGEHVLPPDVLPHTVTSAQYEEVGPIMPTENCLLDDSEMALVQDEDENIADSKPSLVSRLNKFGLGQSFLSRRKSSVKSSVSNLARVGRRTRESRISRKGSIYSGSTTFSQSRMGSRKSMDFHKSASQEDTKQSGTFSELVVDYNRQPSSILSTSPVGTPTSINQQISFSSGIHHLARTDSIQEEAEDDPNELEEIIDNPTTETTTTSTDSSETNSLDSQAEITKDSKKTS